MKIKEIQYISPDLFAPKDAWDKLSMAEKSEMMKVAVRNGITNLQEIRKKYNEFAEGGDTDWSYNIWKKQIALHKGIDVDSDRTYDYEGFFRKYPQEAWAMLSDNPDAHFSDEFKTVYHPTFSAASQNNEGSIYSGVRHPLYNPQGLRGGTWSPDYKSFTMSVDGYRGPVNMDERKWYLENAEDNGVQLREADGSLPIYDGVPWAGVLPAVTVTGKKHSIGGPLVDYLMNEHASGGKIHIKPENRGKFTALKERTGHSATWFKEHGTPAQKKMAVFALNSRKWKHGEGGNLFNGESEVTQQMNKPNIYRRPDGTYFYQATPDSEVITVTPLMTSLGNESQWTYVDSEGKRYTPNRNFSITTAELSSDDRNALKRWWDNYKGEALNDVPKGYHTLPAIGLAAALPIVGEVAAPILANPFVDAGLTSTFAAHGLNHAINEGIDGWDDAAITALEVTPLGRVIKPIAKETAAAIRSYRYPVGKPQVPEVVAPYQSQIDWTPDNWFKNISGRSSYTAEEANEFASFVPEYKEIERQLVKNGTLITDANGNLIVRGSIMSPQEYIMRQSKAFQKMNPEHHYVGVSKGKVDNFENGDYHDFDAWTSRTSPKDVEEYAISPGGGYTFDSQMEDIRHQMSIRKDNFDLHKEQLQWKLDHGKISQEVYDRDMKELKNMFEWKQQVANDELAQLAKQKQMDPLNGGKVYDITYPISAKEAPVVDAQGAHWQHVLFDNNGNPITTTTDHIVSANKGLGYDVTTINNVMDTHNGVHLDETIIHRGTPVKSVLGNTGAFDVTGPNKYKRFRGLIPWLGGASLFGTGHSLLSDDYYSQ